MEETHFITVDLELISYDDLTPLVAEFSKEAIVMRDDKIDGIYYASFEVEGATCDAVMKNYDRLLQKSTPSVKKLWNTCIKRDFDFGFRAGFQLHSFNMPISHKIVKTIAEIGGSISITIYPVLKEHDE